LIVVALIMSGGIASCSADEPAPTTAPSVTAPSVTAPSATAAPPSVAPSKRGAAPTSSFAIARRQVKFSRGKARPLPTTIWYPEAPGPFPLVLFSHGLTSEPSAYASILTAWARAGFVVAAPAYPHTAYGVRDLNALDIVNQPADASYVIGQVLRLATKDGDPLRGRIDPARIAAAGHSAGGITTIGMFSGNRDDRLVAGIVLSGERVLTVPFTGPAAAMLFVHGKLDTTVPYANGLKVFQAVPWSRAMMSVTKGGHVSITKDFGPVIATTTDFLRWSLYGDAAARSRLKGDATKGGRATWTDRL
jgi:poly(3-hydroxybutyrate) depolymerase